jgi:hypothetical protein
VKYSNLISDYRIVRVGELKKTDELGGYQPSDCKYFPEMRVKGGFFSKDEWVRIIPSYDKEASALTRIHSIVYGSTKVTETVVWEGDTQEVRG